MLSIWLKSLNIHVLLVNNPFFFFLVWLILSRSVPYQANTTSSWRIWRGRWSPGSRSQSNQCETWWQSHFKHSNPWWAYHLKNSISRRWLEVKCQLTNVLKGCYIIWQLTLKMLIQRIIMSEISKYVYITQSLLTDHNDLTSSFIAYFTLEVQNVTDYKLSSDEWIVQ